MFCLRTPASKIVYGRSVSEMHSVCWRDGKQPRHKLLKRSRSSRPTFFFITVYLSMPACVFVQRRSVSEIHSAHEGDEKQPRHKLTNAHVHPDLLSSLSTSFVWPTDDCSKHLPGDAESREMTVTVGCLLWLVAGLWTCGLVTGGPPHLPPSLSDLHRVRQSDHGTAMEMELKQQASQIDSLKRQIATQTASFQSQLAALTSQITSLQSSCDAHRAVRSDDVSPMEVELQQQANDITNLKAQLTANRAEISTLQDRMGGFSCSTAHD